MNAGDWVNVALAILLALNLIVLGGAVAVALRRISALSDRLDLAIGDVQKQTVQALQDTHTALSRLAELSSSLETLLKEDVTPTVQVTRSALTSVDVTLRGIADATTSVRRIAAGAEALTSPTAVSEAINKMMAGTGGKAALVAGIALAVLRTIGAGRRAKAAATNQ